MLSRKSDFDLFAPNGVETTAAELVARAKALITTLLNQLADDLARRWYRVATEASQQAADKTSREVAATVVTLEADESKTRFFWSQGPGIAGLPYWMKPCWNGRGRRDTYESLLKATKTGGTLLGDWGSRPNPASPGPELEKLKPARARALDHYRLWWSERISGLITALAGSDFDAREKLARECAAY